MADRVLRDQCEHGRYEAHHFVPLDPPCPGGREMTIDWETVGRIMWDTMFHDIDHWDGLPEKDRQLWLHELPRGFAAALEEV